MAEDSDILGEALAAVASRAVRRTGRQLRLTATSTLATLERTGPRRLTGLAVTEGVTQPSMTAERMNKPVDTRRFLECAGG